MSDRRALIGALLGSSGGGLDWADVTEITVGANTIANMDQVDAYFSNYPYNYIILTTAPTTENQFVCGVRLAQSGKLGGILRYRNGAINNAVVSVQHDGILVEGTKYCLLAWRG